MNNIHDKFYRGVAEINLNAIKKNVSYLKSILPDGSQAVAVIKADAYGHGAREVCRALNDSVSAYAVATFEEACDILDLANGKDVYILGYVRHEEFAFCAEHGIIPVIFSYEDALACSRAATELGKSVRINVKVDTGMGRIGFFADEGSADTVAKIASLPGISTYGIFTHLATSDCSDKSFALCQIERFKAFIGYCETRGISFEKIHCANSAAVIDMPEAIGNQFRMGISMYGYLPSGEVSTAEKLIPAMSFKSHVIFVKKIKKGHSVGYGCTFVAEKDTKIATIPIGYADGYPRALSNKGRVIINGHYANIVGRICMDMFMVDVSGMDVSVGDEVILIGSDKGLTIDADEIAALTGTISYEILCGIGKRIPRRYI